METSPLRLILPDHVLAAQVCRKCCQPLSVGPVNITLNNQQTCGRCETENVGIPSLYNEVATYCIFKCDECYRGCKKLLYFNELTCHKKNCSLKNNKTQCGICDCNLTNASHLVCHYNATHPESISINRDNYVTFNISKKEGLYLYVIDDDIITISWTADDTKFSTRIYGEYRDLSAIGITHYQVKLFNTKCKQVQFSSVKTSSSNEIKLLLNDLKVILGFQKRSTLICKVDFYLRLNKKYMPFRKYPICNAESNTVNAIYLPMKLIINFICLSCAGILKSFWYSCDNTHKLCAYCYQRMNCSECGLALRKYTTQGTFTVNQADGIVALKNIKQVTLNCPWKGCPVFLPSEDTMIHLTNCRFKRFDCPSSKCETGIMLDELKRHWHLDTPLKICRTPLNIVVQDELTIYWIPDEFRNMFKVVVNYLANYEEVIIDVFYVDVISMSDHDCRLKYQHKTYKPEQTAGQRKTFTVKNSIKKYDVIKLYIINTK